MANNAGNGLDIIISVKGDVTDFQKKLTGLSKNVVQIEKDTNNASNSILSFSQKSSEAILKALQESLVGAKKGSAEYKATQQQIKEVAKATLESVKKSVEDYGTSAERAYKRIQDAAAKSSEAAAKGSNATYTEAKRNANNAVAEYDNAVRRAEEGVKRADELAQTLGTKTAESMKQQAEAVLALAKSQKQAISDIYDRILDDQKNVQAQFIQNAKASAQAITGDKVQTFYMPTEEDADAPYKIITETQEAIGKVRQTIYQMSQDTGEFIPVSEKVLDEFTKQDQMVNQLANTLTNLSTKYEMLSQDAQSLSSKTGENYSLSETAQDDAEKLRTLAEELRNEKITIDDAAKAVESFSSRLVENQNQLAQAKTENADMTQSYEKASNVLDKLKERLQNMSISIKAAEENGRTVAGTYDEVKESVSDLIAESDKIKNSGLTGQEFVNAVNELAKSTSNADLKFKELQKTAERMPMTMEQADAAVLSLQNGLNRMSTDVDKVKDKFVSGTFNNITTDIESLRTNLETLQIAFQNGTISEETYTRSLEMMQLQLKTLQTDLIQTKANNEKLVFTQEQAETAANKLAQSMDQLQIRINKVKNSYVNGTFNEATVAIQNNQEALRKLLNEYSRTGDLKTFGEELKKLTNEFNTTTVGLERSAEATGTHTVTGDNFIQNMGKYARWYFGGNLITGAKRQFQEALQEMKAVDAELVQVKKVTDMSDDSLKKMGDRAYEVGKAYGVAASEYLDAVAAFSRAGMKDAAEDLAELSVKASLVGDMAQDDATAMFLAIQKAYGATNDELSLILDGLNELDNKHATTIENITEGLGKVASIASVAHVGYDELAAAIGTVTAVTQRSGTEAATALRALFLNIIGDTKTEITEGETATIASIENIKDALKEYAPDVVEYAEKTKTIINPMEAIKALSTAYKERRLTEQKLMEILSGIGGKLRTSQLTALVMNWEEYESQLNHFNDAFGSADKEVENALGSWDKKVQILKNTWTQFIAESVNTDKIKGIIDNITNIIELVGNLGNALTILLGIIVTIKMQKIVTGIGQIVKSIGSLLSGTVTLATAATGLQVAFGAVALGVTAAFLALQKYRQGLHKATEEASENAARTKKHADDLSDLYINYQFAEKGSKNFKDASEKLADALKIERDELGKLNAVYDEHIKKSIEVAHQDAVIAEAAAERELQATNRTNVFNSDKYFVTKYIDQLPQKVQKQVRAIMGKALSQGTIMLGSMPMFDLDRNTRTFENVLNPKSNSTNDIMNYYSVISEIMGVIAESSQDAEEGFNLVGNAAYESAQKVIGLYSASVDAYTSEHQHKLELEAQLVILDAVSKGILKDEESLKEWSEEIQNSTEYSDEFKEVILRLAEAMKVDLLGTIEDVNEGAEDAADAVEEATFAVKKFQDALKEKNTDALDDYVKLFKEFKEASDSGKYGSKQFQYGLQALFTDEKIASANGDWASLAKEAEKLQKALSSADNSGIEFFDYLKKEGKSIGDHVWEIADGVLTIKQNSNGSWSWDIFGETAEELAASISRISEETGLNVELLGAMFQAWGDFDVGGFDLYKQATDLLLGDKKDEYILSGKNIDTDGIHSVLAPAVRDSISTGVGEALGTAEDVKSAISTTTQEAIEIGVGNASTEELHEDLYETTKDAVQSGITDAVNSFQFPASTTAFLDAFFGGLKNGDDPGKALESGLKSAVEAAADVIPRMTDKTKSEVSGMLEGAATSAITASVESGIIEESVAGKIIEGIAPAVEEAVGEIQGIEIPKNFFDTTNISDEFWDVVMSAVMELQDELQDDSNYEGIEDTVDNIGENLKFVLENWEDISEHPEKFSDDIQTIYNICKDLLSNNTENLETIKKDNEQLSDAHTWLVFIDDLVQGIANNAKNIDFDFNKGGKGTEEAADGAEEAGEAINALGEAIGGIPSEVSTEFPNNAPAATEETNSLTAAINAVPTSKTITFTIVTKGGIPALSEASGTDYFPGGTAFVNDEPGGYNPELIVEKDKAYIVNGGNPALVHISRGAKIFDADETRRILDGGDKLAAFPRFRVGTTTLEKEENKSGGGKKSSDSHSHSHDSDDSDKNEWFDLLKEYMEELYEDAEAALDEQKEAINAQILALKYQTEAAEKANDLEEKRLEMVKAESDLLDAQHERTVRYFNAETNQWEWMADQQAVLDAQEALADAQKDYLDAQYDYLEDLWKKIEDEISDYLEEKNDLNIEDILNQLSGSAAGSELASVTELIQAIKDFTASPTAGLGLKDIASVYDSGGIASGTGFMPKGNSGDEIVLDSILAGRILSPKHSGELTAFTENLASLLDMSSASANPQSLLNRLSNVTNNNGNNTIINGVSIGSDYMDRPLSDVLSVLGIYANS